MADVAPGHQTAHSEPPPCYNCGLRGHIFTACPEPTRAVPAGLEASRARQASGSGGNGEPPNKRHKGPIVTRYSQPQHSNFGSNQYPHPPPGQHYLSAPPGQHYPYPHQHQHPHGPSPPYHGQYGSGQPPPQPPYGSYGPTQPYGGLPFAQQPHHPQGQSNVVPPPPFIAGAHQYPQPSHLQQYPQHPVYPPPQHYGYGPPPGVLGPPPGPPGFQPPGFQNDSIPPPSYSGYAPPPAPHDHDSYSSDYHSYDNQWKARSDDRYPRDKWRDRRGDKRNGYGRDRDRHSRNYSRDEHWYDRGRQDTREGLERRKHEKPYGERTAHDREPLRSSSRPGSEMSNRSGSQKPTLTLNSSSHTTPKQHIPEPAIPLPPKPVATIQTSRVGVDSVIQLKSHDEEGELDVEPKPTDDMVSTLVETDTVTEDNETESNRDFLEELEAVFTEPSVQHHGDPIAEPLPNEYSEAVMLPPAFDAKGVKSKHITTTNLDDFALSVRDTNQWNKYRHHPIFLAPGEVNLQNLALYMKLSQKSQGPRHDKRGRQAHAQHHAREQGRNQRFTNRGDKDQRHPAPFPKKRKWDDRTEPVYGHEVPYFSDSNRPLRYAKSTDPPPPQQMSPEPGEISDTPVSATFPPSWPTVPLPPLDNPLHWPPKGTPYADDQGRHHQFVDQSHSYDDYPKLDRPGAPLHYGGHSRSPHYSGWEGRSPSPKIHHQFEQPGSHEHGAPSPRPILDESQPNLNKAWVETASNDNRELTSDEVVHNHNAHLATLHGSADTSPRHGSQESDYGSRPASRRSSAADVSEASDLGSPLTRIEAELLGLVGADGNDSDADSPKRQQEAATTLKRKQRKKVHSVYDRRW